MKAVDRRQIKLAAEAMVGAMRMSDPKSFLIDFSACLYAVCAGGPAEALRQVMMEDPQQGLEHIYWRYPQLPQREYRREQGICSASQECRGYVGEIMRLIDAEADSRFEQAARVYHAVFDSMIQERLIEDFITPESLCDLMVQMTNPMPGEQVADPACGSGRFLAAVHRQCPDCILTGMDVQPEFRELAFFNLFFSGRAEAEIWMDDFLSGGEKLPKADLILSNPPYTDKSELTVRFTDRILHQLKDGGRCGLLVPQGFLTNSSSYLVRDERRFILDQCRLEAVISLPRKIYRPYMESYSSLILIRKSRTYGDNYPVFISILPECEETDPRLADQIYRAGMKRILSQWKRYQEGGTPDEEIARVVSSEDMRSHDLMLAAETYWTEGYVPAGNEIDELLRGMEKARNRLDELLEELLR